LAIENKIGADFQTKQIERYKHKYGENVFVIFKCLSDVDQALEAKEAISWYEVNSEVRDYISKLPKTYNNNKRFILNDFVKFLEETGMAIKKVSYEIVNGVDSLLNLCTQTDEALNRGMLNGTITKYKTNPGSRNYTGWEIKNVESVFIYLLYSPLRFVSCFWSKKDHSKNYKEFLEILPDPAWKDHWVLKTLDITENNYLCSGVDEQILILENFISDTLATFSAG